MTTQIPSPRRIKDSDQQVDLVTTALPSTHILRSIHLPNPHEGTEYRDVDLVVALAHDEDLQDTEWQAFAGLVDGSIEPCSGTYVVDDAGSSGLGVFATNDIGRGNLIMRERPLLLCPLLLPYRSSWDEVDQYPELKDAISYMTPPNQDAFHSLAKSSLPGKSAVKSIIDTNALYLGPLQIGSPQAREYSGVCRDISRINHSCSPNAAYRFDLRTFTFEVRALFSIPAGDQIVISYIDAALPRNKRLERLSAYDFSCSCTACSLSGVALVQSENRRALIARADSDIEGRDAALERWARTPSIPSDYINHVDKMYMDLFEKERLYYEPVWEGFAVRLCKACCALKDSDGARKWASLAAALSRAYTGDGRGWQVVADAPERTDWWGRRCRNTTQSP
ncbi:hypothetical protein C8Q79DRAFT_915392 [Trametes meyenii]|nr:hypothetical protein C8Q79DRAFT_915392 [Trametes meyenii]